MFETLEINTDLGMKMINYIMNTNYNNLPFLIFMIILFFKFVENIFSISFNIILIMTAYYVFKYINSEIAFKKNIKPSQEDIEKYLLDNMIINNNSIDKIMNRIQNNNLRIENDIQN